MSSFWGYVTEGFLLLVLALWWLVNTSYDIIQSRNEKREFRPKMTYTWPGTNIPVEIFYKLFISCVGFFGQLAYSGGSFHDADGNFDNMTQLLYMSVYAIFLLHSLLDIALWWGIPVVKGSNYAAAATGFFWYAMALYNRSHDFHESGPVAMMALTFPVYLLLPISVVYVLEPMWRSGFGTQLVRAYCLQAYGTWCWQSGYILHAHNGFPGSEPNPAWNQTDHGNTAYTAAFFGLHLCLNLVFAAATYSLTACFLRMRLGFKIENEDYLPSGYDYKPLSTKDNSAEADGSGAKLLSAYVA